MGGIGTRRWAKFAKYFANSGYKVHVLTIDYLYKDKVNWLNDIDSNENIIVHRISSGYLNLILKENKSFLEKVFSKVIGTVLNKTFFYVDVAQNWAKYMIPYASKLITQENIKNVIVTSPPHTVAYYATYLKVQFPTITLIQDFRDNWNDDQYYEYKIGLDFFWQKEKSTYMETFTIQHSDYMLNVTDDITKRTIMKYKQYEDKFKTIYNGYDKDDINNLQRISETKNDKKIKIIYAGSLDGGRIKAVEMLLDTMLDLTAQELNKIEINLYSNFKHNMIDIKYKKLVNTVVKFHSFVSPSEILSLIDQHQYCLSINSPIYPYAFGTKIFDYMMLNKKIIHISGYGELSNLLIEMGQFVADYNKEEIKNMFEKILVDDEQVVANYDKFNIKNLTKDIERLFNYE